MNNTIVVPLNDTIIFTVLITLFVFISVLSCVLEIFLVINACCVRYPSIENNNQEQQQELQGVEPLPLGHREDTQLSQEGQINENEALGKNKKKLNVEFRFYWIFWGNLIKRVYL